MTKKIDPRVIRTKNLIMEAFIELTAKKDFKDITIKDITDTATINHATFYNHFYDKYDLLEKVIRESFMRDIIQEVSNHKVINVDTIKSIFSSITKFQLSIKSKCYRSYEVFSPEIEIHFKNELHFFLSKWAHKQWPNKTNPEIEAFSVTLSWALYGSATHWMNNQQIKPENYVAQMIPLIDTMDKDYANQL